jgi:hypothetical protein
MTTINLHQQYEQQDQEEQQKIFLTGNGGLFLSLGILAFTCLVVFGLWAMVKNYEKQNGKLETQIKTETESLGKMIELKDVVDTQTRLAEIKNNLQIKDNKVMLVPMTTILNYIGDATNNSGAFLSLYKYEEGNKIALTFNTSSFDDSAKQILNFKGSNNFTNVSLSKISRGEKYVTCDMTMNLQQ